MTFFDLVYREMHGTLPRLAFMAGLSGVSNTAILAAINSGAQAASTGQVNLWAAMLFVVSLLLSIQTQRYLLIVTTAEIEAIIHKLRVRLMDDVRRAELLPLDAIGRAQVVSALTKDTATLAQAANMLGSVGQGAVLVVLVAFYVAYLSLAAFVLSIVIVSLAGLVIYATSHAIQEGMRKAAEWENSLFDRLTDLLDGFKEVRLNEARSDDLFSDITEVSRTAANVKISTKGDEFKGLVFAQSTLYLLLAAVAFVVPTITSTSGPALVQTTMALLFVVGTSFGIVRSIPLFTAANAATDNIAQLEAAVRAANTAAQIQIAPSPRFSAIEMHDVVFRYADPSSDSFFQVGPVDFTLRSGELVFIMGGNGSGKSTFLRVLAGLYAPNSGQIILDGTRIDNANRNSYRALIAAVFTDYHLFRRLYGIPDPDASEVERLLTQFLLHDKIRLIDREFQPLNLSTGQRKRLALIVSLLEKRPILLLDEWAADQDPEFRHKFYHELLPTLNRAGVTLVVVTHDTRYIDELEISARKLRMDEGRFVAQNIEAER